MKQWREIEEKEIPALNQQLKKANLPEVKLQSASLPARATATARDKDEE